VATTVGDVGTVLNGGGTHAGVLVPPGDATALARALTEVLSDPTEARRLAAAAALRAEDYTLAKMTERYVALYTTLLSSG
jgi:glycosyltransferase involved in cell wall biosynthesis